MLAFLLILAAGDVTGSVFYRQQDQRLPAGGVRVQARGADTGTLLQAAATNASGGFLLAGLPENTRIQLTASKPGFYCRAAASQDRTLVVDLAAGEQLRGADFELLPGGVLAGRITDQWDEPVENAEVEVARVLRPGSPRRDPAVKVRTNDLGRYRAFGLEPGFYVLQVRPAVTLAGDFGGPRWYPGALEEAEAQEIEVAPGRETAGIDLVLRPDLLFSVGGRITGVPPDRIKGALVLLTRPGSASGSGFLTAQAGPEGSFSFTGVAPGSYLLQASLAGGQAESGAPRVQFRQKLQVSGDLQNLLLGPAEFGRVSGRLGVPERAGRRPPQEVRLRLLERGVPGSMREAAARAPDYRFEFPDVWPGAYSAVIAAPEDASLVALRADGRLLTGPLEVREGAAAVLEVEVNIGKGSVRGTVGGAQPLPHARVALARAGDPTREVLTSQADQRGRFVFTAVPPGQYVAAAWHPAEQPAFHLPATWKRAGAAAKPIQVEPGAEVELALAPVNGGLR